MKKVLAWMLVIILSFGVGMLLVEYVALVSLFLYITGLFVAGWLIAKLVLFLEKKLNQTLL